MKILTVHNLYQVKGGEEEVFQAETNLLRLYGNQVEQYVVDNSQIGSISPLILAKKTLWNTDVFQDLRSLIKRKEIELVHFHNTFPLISPAAYYATKAEGIPVVQTFHNYRLLCPNALFMRDGKTCEDCLGQFFPLPGIVHGCYRGSRSASGVVAAMLAFHRMLGTWRNQVDVYITLTEFARNKFIQGGLPSNKIVVKSNFVHPDPGIGRGSGGYAIYVGRLSIEKGVDLLLSAWKQLSPKIPLKILGDGPLAPQVQNAAAQIPGIEWLGRQPLEQVFSLLKEAAFLVFPSQWYEGLPRILIESFAVGTPVISSDIGAMSSLIEPHQTGIFFKPQCVSSLVEQIEWAISKPLELARMRQTARIEFETKYTAEINYAQLIQAYKTAQTFASKLAS